MDTYPAGRPRAERFWRWLAWRVPGPLAYWCAVRVIAHATTGAFDVQVVPELTAMEALKRWEDDRGGDVRRSRSIRLLRPPTLGGD